MSSVVCLVSIDFIGSEDSKWERRVSIRFFFHCNVGRLIVV